MSSTGQRNTSRSLSAGVSKPKVLNGRGDEGLQILTSVSAAGPVGFQRNTYLGIAYTAAGKRDLAADAILATTDNQHMVTRAAVENAARLLREDPAQLRARNTTPDPSFYLSFVQALSGSPDVALSGVDLWLHQIGFAGTVPVYSLWHPAYSPARKTERFKDVVRKAGLVDYWKERGWPDLCRPLGADDFVCD